MNPVQLFEHEFAKYVNVPYTIAVNSGTAALHVALVSIGLGYGDMVITTPYTFPSTANAILMAGATPVFVDVGGDLLIDSDQIEKACKRYLQIKCVLPVHLFGRPCNMDTIMELAHKYGFRVIEDASQAIGAEYKGVKLGTIGDAGTYSFYATKNLSAYQGGMIVTNRKDIYEKARQYRRHGFNEKGMMMSFGYNYEMPWNCAFHGWQNLRNHKVGIEAELGRYDENDGYYSYLVYQHPFYQNNKNLWKKLNCQKAEEAAEKVRKQRAT